MNTAEHGAFCDSIPDKSGYEYKPPIENTANRRRKQIQENTEIGNGEIVAAPKPDIILLDDALERYALITDGKRVIDRQNPKIDMTLDEWRLAHKASSRKDETGKTITVASEWESNINRITTNGKTFKAGASEFVFNPAGIPCINTWKALYRSDVIDNQYLPVFLDHMEFLIPDESIRNRFLDWLAHIEQMPGELPHTAWLHIATSTGMGRNWLTSVLSRVWSGYVAANYNLIGTLGSGFNGGLSEKLLANVDELHEGGVGQWQHAERFKSLLTEEFKTINPKYGRASIEFNACRWLAYSNHLSALPIASNDRRIEVVVNEGSPQSESYYKRLYGVLKKRSFIDSVANFLKVRDISLFNPGAHAAWSDDKHAVVNTSKSGMTEIAELTIKHWPEDLISAQALLDILNSEKDGYPSLRMNPQMNKTLEELGIKRADIRRDIGGRKQAIYILRNRNNWCKDNLTNLNVRKIFSGAKAGNANLPHLSANLLNENIV